MIEPGLALIIGPSQARVGSGVEVLPPSGTAPYPGMTKVLACAIRARNPLTVALSLSRRSAQLCGCSRITGPFVR